MGEENKSSVFWVSVWVVLFLLLIFFAIEVTKTHSLIVTSDLRFENMLLDIRTSFLIKVFNVITLLGNALVVMGIAGIVGIILLFSRHYRAYAVGLAVTLIGAAATDYGMKEVMERARPDGLIPSIIETSFSFPSGHATAAMALYGFAAYILCVLFPARKLFVVATAVLVIGIIGFSRLYLGLHFPSDVIAGYILGGLWLLIGIECVRRTRNGYTYQAPVQNRMR